MRHELKTWPIYYDAIASGTKRFEIRKDDRPFRVGDTLLLREWEPRSETYTRRRCAVRVTWILRDAEYFGLQRGFVAMSIVREPKGA